MRQTFDIAISNQAILALHNRSMLTILQEPLQQSPRHPLHSSNSISFANAREGPSIRSSPVMSSRSSTNFGLRPRMTRVRRVFSLIRFSSRSLRMVISAVSSDSRCQTWTVRFWPYRRTRPIAWVMPESHSDCSGRTSGERKITWLIACRFLFSNCWLVSISDNGL